MLLHHNAPASFLFNLRSLTSTKLRFLKCESGPEDFELLKIEGLNLAQLGGLTSGDEQVAPQ